MDKKKAKKRQNEAKKRQKKRHDIGHGHYLPEFLLKKKKKTFAQCQKYEINKNSRNSNE